MDLLALSACGWRHEHTHTGEKLMGYGGHGDWVNKEDAPVRQRTIDDYSEEELTAALRRKRLNGKRVRVRLLEIELEQLKRELADEPN
jgi:hypothetical protein